MSTMVRDIPTSPSRVSKPLEVPRLRAELAPGFHAEAVFSTEGQQLMLQSDDGTNNADVTCGAAPKDGQRFRAMRMKLN